MKNIWIGYFPERMQYFKIYIFLLLLASCSKPAPDKTAAELLGNPEYPAIAYGGYRGVSRNEVPTIAELKEDLHILSALGMRFLRTYNTQQYPHAERLLQAIREIKNEHSDFEMYVMLGAWIACKDAWTAAPDHSAEDLNNNDAEIDKAVALANAYPDIVKVIAVGNEAMVHWAAAYYVEPEIILERVNQLQLLKQSGQLHKEVWITSSDNYESWGGGDPSYHKEGLRQLIEAVDYLSLHTYPFHDSHYNPAFWVTPDAEASLPDKAKVEASMDRALDRAKSQYQAVVDYMKSMGVDKPVHIGESGWATVDQTLYGGGGSRAADEYKAKIYYDKMRAWTQSAGISCFYFEAFDEQWKDAGNPAGSENHFGLFTLDGKAKYPLWDKVDQGIFDGPTRGGQPVTKTFGGDTSALLAQVFPPPGKKEIALTEINTVNDDLSTGTVIRADRYLLLSETHIPASDNDYTYPSAVLKLNAWEGTCNIGLKNNQIVLATGTGDWWGAALEIQAGGTGEDLSAFSEGFLHFDIRGTTRAKLAIGLQTGAYTKGNQQNLEIVFAPGTARNISDKWQHYALPLAELSGGKSLRDVQSLLHFRGLADFDGGSIFLKEIGYSR